MESVTIDGVMYTRARTVAKRFHYTTDYLGQLCRAEKISCQLVGRSWFVDESSLEGHKDTRYKSLRENEKTSKNNTISSIDTVIEPVAPRLKKTALKVPVAATFAQTGRPTVASVRVKYVPDDGELLPQTRRKIVPRLPEIVVEKALVDKPRSTEDDLAAPEAAPLVSASVRVAVRQVEKSNEKLGFTELPAVALRGEVRVADVDVPMPTTDLAALPPRPASVVRQPSSMAAPTALAPVPMLDLTVKAPTRFTPLSVRPDPVSTVSIWLTVSVSTVAALAVSSVLFAGVQVMSVTATDTVTNVTFLWLDSVRLLASLANYL